MGVWRTLFYGQLACYFAAGILGGVVLYEYGLAASGIPGLALCLILAAIGWLGPQIVHELSELNDQLAGRSKELQELPKKVREIRE